MQFPRWLSWVVLVFLAYILFVGNSPRERKNPEPATVAVSDKDYPHLQALVDGERWVKGLNPDYRGPNEACRASVPPENQLTNAAIILKEGTGADAACGDTIELSITRYGNDGRANKPAVATLTLGEQKELDALLVGMRAGEQRLLVVNLPEQVKHLNLPAHTQLVLSVMR